MSTKWRGFWQSYRNSGAVSEDDLFFQVGKTIGGKPIADEIFRRMIGEIRTALELGADDHLFDMCCGNGLITKELAGFVRKITAVDFARHLIESARIHKAAPNVEYIEGDVLAQLTSLPREDAPRKFLMNDALAYFDPGSLGRVLDSILAGSGVGAIRFLVTGIPDEDRKLSFYDTPERLARHRENQQREKDVNDGLGRWWRAVEIQAACRERGLAVRIHPQPAQVSTYRMDALVWRG